MTASDTALIEHRRARRRSRGALILLALACVGMLLLSLLIGPSDLPPGKAVDLLLGRDIGRAAEFILLQLRLPMAVLGLLAGAALGLAGAELQTVMENPLAEPYTLGVSSSAALGAAVAIVLGVAVPGIGAFAVPLNAFLFSFAALMLVQALISLRGAGTDMLVLFGIGVGLTASALLSLVQYMASADALQALIFWMMGSLTRADATTNKVLAVVLAVALPWSLASARSLQALRLGADRAEAMGVSVARVRLFSLIRISLLAGTAVAFIGIVGFVGLIAPHIARLCLGEEQRPLLLGSALVGALILCAAGLVSGLLVTGIILPVGIVTALVGLPVFFIVVMKRGGL
ncbi:iron ABC transporter permease [Paracoccus caeni]|uniref:Iron ABC transporter permease n=1 Tax=Paracoccus caeni TaxID=657651 RepID=A0A934SH67_9RHOB|nr:iron ABC transporter permease [Paracoccus caeni]MBK4215119.1 iron ABC transporter permease [Paracoccus caeni]